MSNSNVPLWKKITKISKSYPLLDQDIEVDVAIIGGGITGITAADQLLNQGKKVAILEAHCLGEGTSGYSTGNLYVPIQAFYQNVASKFNFETAKLIAHSRQFAIDFIESNIHEKKINCQFTRRPWYGYKNNKERASFTDEIELLKKMEIPVEYTHHLPLEIKFTKAAMIPDQARFNPLQYLIGMAENIFNKGGLIYENTKITHFEDKEIGYLYTHHAKIRANKIIVATHTPIGIHSVQMKIAPYRSYVLGVTLKNQNYPEGHFYDFGKLTHAICTHAVSSTCPEILLVAGSHHKTGQGKNMTQNYDILEEFVRKNFEVDAFPHRWSAQHYQAADDIPYIGNISGMKNVFTATGYFADGLVYGTLAGIILSDIILKKDNPLIQIYQANRFKPIASAPALLKENFNVLLQYLKDYPFFKKMPYNHIACGEGKIIEVNKEKLAVSRDENNQLHIVSAVCPHMKCIVNWNNAEKTWDCPCHGSRFSNDGSVIEGPATQDLTKQAQE